MREDPKKSITASWENRNNYFALNIEDTPHFDLIQLSTKYERKFNETDLSTAIFYILKDNAKTNRLDISIRSSSNMEMTNFQFEANLQHPSFNTLLQTKLNKYTGNMIYTNFKFGKLLR